MLDSAGAIVGMLTIGLIGLGFEYIFTRMERKLNW
jgi:ABC-type nitrate/sulfonate/bicarbonate transport system permease component